MRRELKLSELRAKFQQEVRRDTLSRTFKQHRQTLLEESQKHDEEQFNKVYPCIDQDNLEQHLPFLLKYSYNEQYNYRLVVFAGYLYDYLLEHKHSREALDILESLSQFEQIEIPQTEQFAEVLILNLPLHCRTVLSIVASLLEHHRYCSGLRQDLVAIGFVSAAEEAIAQSSQAKLPEMQGYINGLYFEILCLMITTHPVVQDHVFTLIVDKLKFRVNEEVSFILFDRLERLTSSVVEQEARARAIDQAFGDLMLKEYFNYQWQVVSILQYCLRSKVQFDKKFGPLLAKSLTSPNPRLREKIILILQMLERQDEQNQLILNEQSFLINILGVYDASSEPTKLKILELLQKIIRKYLTRTFQQGEMVSEANHLFILPRLSITIHQALEPPNTPLATSAVAITFSLLSTLAAEKLEATQEILANMQQEGIFEQLRQLQQWQNQQAREKVFASLALLETLQDEINGPDSL